MLCPHNININFLLFNSDDDMISIGSMMSLNDDYYLDDNDDDMEVVPSPRLRHKRNLSSGNMKVLPGMYYLFCQATNSLWSIHLKHFSVKDCV